MARGPYIINLVEGDLLPFLEVEWEDQDVTGFNILLHVRKPNGTTFTRTAVIDETNAGEPRGGSAFFHFEWLAGDLDPGDSQAEVEAFNTAGKNETFQGFILRVAKDIA